MSARAGPIELRSAIFQLEVMRREMVLPCASLQRAIRRQGRRRLPRQFIKTIELKTLQARQLLFEMDSLEHAISNDIKRLNSARLRASQPQETR